MLISFFLYFSFLERRMHKAWKRHIYQSVLATTETNMICLVVPYDNVHEVDLERQHGRMYWSKSGFSVHGGIVFEFTRNSQRFIPDQRNRNDVNFDFVRAYSLSHAQTVNQDALWQTRHVKMVQNRLAVDLTISAVSKVALRHFN